MIIKNPFTAAKRLTAILVALAGFGIDAEDEKTDVAAAIQAKIDEAKGSTDVAGAIKLALDKEREAHVATTTVLREKADMFDALEKQASEAGIDLRTVAGAGTLAETIDGKARDTAKKVLGQNAPESVEIDAAPEAPPAGSNAALAAQYSSLLEAGKKEEASALFSKHAAAILPFLDIELPE